MIISASRRTDIPAAHAEWLRARLDAGECYVKNPYNPNQARRVSLSTEDVDALVLWTKSPRPLLDDMRALDKHRWVMNFTLNDAPEGVEPMLPPVAERVSLFQTCSRMSSPERVTWRYDPVYITEAVGVPEHIERFTRIADELCQYTRACVVSFLDVYAFTAACIARHGLRAPAEDEARALASAFSAICRERGVRISACAEERDYSEEGLPAGPCLSAEALSACFGRDIAFKRDKNQRKHCLCSQSIDIGAYGTCPNGCVYCYANRSKTPRPINPNSPSLS